MLSSYLPKGLVRDIAWDVLLELFVSHGEGRAVCVKQLRATAAEPPTTTIRLLNRLEEAALIERITDEHDHRRTIVRLSSSGRSAMAAGLRGFAPSLSLAS